MKIILTNQTVFSTDWSSADRQTFLRSIPKTRRQPECFIAPGFLARGVWMKDVSFIDRRSVKAQLTGRGDYRVIWWRINQRVHRVLQPHASLEQKMYAFHKRHHALTIILLTLAFDYRDVFQAIWNHGFAAGIRCGIAQCSRADGSQNEPR